MKILTNAFSLQMLPEEPTEILIREVPVSEVEFDKSVVGHADAAVIMSQLLGVYVPFNRETIKLCFGDILYVGQIIGGRLPEGTTTLQEGVQIRFFEVVINRQHE